MQSMTKTRLLKPELIAELFTGMVNISTKKLTGRINSSCEKELQYVERHEKGIRKRAKAAKSDWRAKIEEKIPHKVMSGLKAAFAKAFEIVLQKGAPLIEKTYDREELMTDYMAQDMVVELKGNRRALKRMRSLSTKGQLVNSVATTVEGIALGALGIGLPDIIAFIAMLLKGIFEIALQYGHGYESNEEKYLILKMLEASLSKDEAWDRLNKDVDILIESVYNISDKELKEQIKATADAMALEMLVLKFVQGLPVVGIVGGMGNPVYYNKVLKYVKLKYYKRYLLKKQTERRV